MTRDGLLPCRGRRAKVAISCPIGPMSTRSGVSMSTSLLCEAGIVRGLHMHEWATPSPSDEERREPRSRTATQHVSLPIRATSEGARRRWERMAIRGLAPSREGGARGFACAPTPSCGEARRARGRPKGPQARWSAARLRYHSTSAHASRRRLEAADAWVTERERPAPFCGTGEQGAPTGRCPPARGAQGAEERAPPRPEAQGGGTGPASPPLHSGGTPTTGTPERRGSGTAHDEPAPPPAQRREHRTLRGCGALPERRFPR